MLLIFTTLPSESRFLLLLNIKSTRKSYFYSFNSTFIPNYKLYSGVVNQRRDVYRCLCMSTDEETKRTRELIARDIFVALTRAAGEACASVWMQRNVSFFFDDGSRSFYPYDLDTRRDEYVRVLYSFSISEINAFRPVARILLLHRCCNSLLMQYNNFFPSFRSFTGKYAALWPFLGICTEVVILCIIILIYEKKRDKTELEEN
jgi:hypothetical protein